MTSPRAKFVLVTALLLLATPSYADNDVPVVCFRTSDFAEPNTLPERQIESLYKLAFKAVPSIERAAIKRAKIFKPENAEVRDRVLLTDICEDDGKSCVGLAYRRHGKGFLTAQKFWYGARGLTHTSLDPDSESDTPFADSRFFSRMKQRVFLQFPGRGVSARKTLMHHPAVYSLIAQRWI